MVERRTLGRILMDSGRIGKEDCDRALEYQRDHGGYFGEALVALGLVSEDELEWGLASQFDLPYIFPDADSVDPEAANLVSPEWALAHLSLPIMRTGDTLTVVVESPSETDVVDELHARTDLRIELALASPEKIRELIRQVYARGTAAAGSERPTPIHLTEAVTVALETAATRFGISTRGRRSWAWWDDSGMVRRRPLEGLWESELAQLLTPPPRDQVRGKARARWTGLLDREGMAAPVEVRYLGDPSGHEYLFRPVDERSPPPVRFPAPTPGITSEIRLLARSGSARFVVTSEPETLGHEVLPNLPALLLDRSWRSVHIHGSERSVENDAFGLRLPADPERWEAELETLRAFHFDVVTVDLIEHQDDWARTALDVASVTFLLWPIEMHRRPAHDAGIRWELHIAHDEEGSLEWTLEPLHA